MVHLFDYPFPDKNSISPEINENYQDYIQYFDYFDFELSNFQKWALYSIVNNQHTLVTAHTGSGKTLPAEFSIRYFIDQGKKVIYTSPIKALSNQKFNEFQSKFPDINIGILTGDNKHNPEADVIIMTTEILRNQLLSLIPKDNNNNIPVHDINNFSMDIHNDCGIIIFDEIHYIDDPDRGAVWEQCIMHSPKNIPFLMLSASIGKPEQFASWIESTNPNKFVNICPTNVRIVPLKHYSFLTLPQSQIDQIKNNDTKSFIQNITNKFNIIKDDSSFYDSNFNNNIKALKFINDNNIICYRKFVFNQAINLLKNNNMLPALCFVFSRKQVEIVASEITTSLFTEDELYDDPIPNTIEKTCKNILISKIINWREYIIMPEYLSLISCLKNGVAFHHAGMIPVFKEMVEILYSMKKIKLLIATETFAVGLNMPTKTVIFSSMYKFNGNNSRILEGHEYTQMSGRAGRRGIDDIGYVIHLNNLYELPNISNFKNIINSKPKIIKSKFKINIPFIMNIIASNEFQENPNTENLCKHIEKSMMNVDILSQINASSNNIIELQTKINQYQIDNDFIQLCESYSILKDKLKYSNNKQKKKLNNQINTIINNNHNFLNKFNSEYVPYYDIKNKYDEECKYKSYAENYINHIITSILQILKNNLFIDDNMKLTSRGIVASSMMETHGLIFSDLFFINNGFSDLSCIEILQLLSCFYPLKISDDNKTINTNFISSSKLKSYVDTMIKKNNFYYDIECSYNIDVGYSYDYQLDLILYFSDWVNIENQEQTIIFFNKLKSKGIFTGDFIKSCIKINNIIRELKTICEFTQKYETLEKINQIEKIINKSIISSESLYL